MLVATSKVGMRSGRANWLSRKRSRPVSWPIPSLPLTSALQTVRRRLRHIGSPEEGIRTWHAPGLQASSARLCGWRGRCRAENGLLAADAFFSELPHRLIGPVEGVADVLLRVRRGGVEPAHRDHPTLRQELGKALRPGVV